MLPDNTTTLAGDAQAFQADSHVDMGYLLLFLPVLLDAVRLPARVGIFGLALIMVAGLGVQPGTAQAGVWADLWATPDQQGQAAFEAQRLR